MTREIWHLEPEDSLCTPWRNGGGVTEQLAIHPDSASMERMDFEWRISKSRVESDGPFSSFAGYERTLVVTDGAGLVLSHRDAAPRSRLRPFEPYRFDGEWDTRAELAAGPIADFNVFARRGAWNVEVQVTRIGARRTRELVGPHTAFVHVLSGRVVLRIPSEEEPFELHTGDSVQASELGSAQEFEIAGTSRETIVILVRLDALA